MAFLRAHSRLTVCLSGSLLLLVLWGLQANPYLNPADDSGRYMVLGESVARSGSLRLLNDSHHPLDTLYPPGLPLIIAFWLRLTGRGPGEIVLLVKATHIVLLVLMLPLLYRLLEKAGLPRGYLLAGVLLAALCPAVASIGNEVMTEAPFLALCLAAVTLSERWASASVASPNAQRRGKRRAARESPLPGQPNESDPQALTKVETPVVSAGWDRFLSLACAGGAFLMRTAGLSLLIAQGVWFWRRFGWKWGVAALLAAGIIAGGWQIRNHRIIYYHPKTHYDTYVDQFTLRDPGKLGAGRISLDASGLWERASKGLPAYVGMIPRVLLTMMSPPRTFFSALFYTLAIPITLLILAGWLQAWQRGLCLTCGFSALFWLFAAMWPWINPRFILPLLPYLLLFLLLGAQAVSDRLRAALGPLPVRLLQAVGIVLLLVYWTHVHALLIHEEGRPTLPNYTLGRTSEEGGYYAACEWLKTQGDPRDIVMGRPQYLLHLYSGHATTQIEPISPLHPQMQEVYMKNRHVRYLLEDRWSWSHSDQYLGAYLHRYADERWTLAWQDPQGSGVRVWLRKPPLPKPDKTFHAFSALPLFLGSWRGHACYCPILLRLFFPIVRAHIPADHGAASARADAHCRAFGSYCIS